MNRATAPLPGAVRRLAGWLALVSLVVPTLAAATGGDPPSLPIGNVRAPGIAAQHDAATATTSGWSDTRPAWQDNSTALSIDGEVFSPSLDLVTGDMPLSVGGAIALHRQYAARIEVEQGKPVPDETEIARAKDGLARIETALAQKLRTTADRLAEPTGFGVDFGTRASLNQVNETFFGLQVAAARRDIPDFDVLYDRTIDNVSLGLDRLVDQQETEAIRRQSIIEFGGHHLALDIYFDGRERLASVVILDSIWGSVAKIEQNLSSSLPNDFHLVATHYATRQQDLCLGCRQFALETARAMRGMNIHDAPLERLLAAVDGPRNGERDDGERLFDQIDPRSISDAPDTAGERANLTRRLGELPPDLFRLTNRERSWTAYRQAREAYLADRSPEERAAGRAELDFEQAAITQSLVGRASQSRENVVNPWNLAIDDARRDGIERLAQRFENGRGGEVMQSHEREAMDVLSSPSARAAGAQQRTRLQVLRERRTGLPDTAADVATDEPHDEATIASSGTDPVADRVLDRIVAERDARSAPALAVAEHEVTVDADHEERVSVADLVRRFEALTNTDRPWQRRDRDDRDTRQEDQRPAERVAESAL